MADLQRWNDDRLDDLHRTVVGVAAKVEDVGRLDERISGLSKMVARLEAAISGFAEKLDDLGAEPLRRAAALREQAKIAMFAALAGAVAVFIATKLAGA